MTDKRLAPGDPAPDFTLPDADGHPVALSSFRGQRVIVYFYPAAMTPGCTKEACDFRDSLADLNSAGIIVLGVSPDQPRVARPVSSGVSGASPARRATASPEGRPVAVPRNRSRTASEAWPAWSMVPVMSTGRWISELGRRASIAFARWAGG